jgi:Predicted nucleotidyltransferases
MQISSEQVKNINNFLVQRLDPYLVVLFGSAAKGNFREGSDIDLAYSSDREVPPYEVFMLSQELAGMLGRDVHLLNLNQVSTVMRVQVIANGNVILDREPNRRQEFYILVWKMYARLNEEREPVLLKIKERGSVLA